MNFNKPKINKNIFIKKKNIFRDKLFSINII